MRRRSIFIVIIMTIIVILSLINITSSRTDSLAVELPAQTETGRLLDPSLAHANEI